MLRMEGGVLQYEQLDPVHRRLPPCKPVGNQPSKLAAVRLGLEQHGLVKVGGVGERIAAAGVNLPHGLLHLRKAETIIADEIQEVIAYVPRIPHRERSDVPGAGGAAQLVAVEVVNELLSRRARQFVAAPPVRAGEQLIEIVVLVGMVQETVDLLEHEIDENPVLGRFMRSVRMCIGSPVQPSGSTSAKARARGWAKRRGRICCW